MRTNCSNPIWRRRLEDTCELFKHLRRCRSAGEICSCLLKYADSIGATNLLAGVIPPPSLSKSGQLSHVLLDSWPKEWSERYFSSGYLYRDPTIRLVREGTTSFLWSELDAQRPISLREKSVMSEATEFRLIQGFTIALSTVERQPIGISIAGERLEFCQRERLSLELVSAYAAGCAIVLMEGDRRPEIRLSPRQLDVLRWASEGLKTDDIADRLSISAHTAEMHLRAIREKLGVTNTVHAVAEALRLELIS